jgi:UDP-3-O-[3-hydroxymyristoyl] glucosamine N-acyltransferase
VTGDDDPDDPAPPKVPERAPLPAGTSVNGTVLVGDRAELGAAVRIDGPAVIGPDCSIGDGVRIKRSVLLPGATVPAAGLLAGAIAGRRGD